MKNDKIHLNGNPFHNQLEDHSIGGWRKIDQIQSMMCVFFNQLILGIHQLMTG